MSGDLSYQAKTFLLEGQRDRHHEWQKLHLDWLRYTVGLAAGAFAVLAGLAPEVNVSLPGRYFLAAAWLFLGLGLVFGIAALYSRVWLVRKEYREFLNDVVRALEEDRLELLLEVQFQKLPWWLAICAPITILSLFFSVVCLVGYAVIRTLG